MADLAQHKDLARTFLDLVTTGDVEELAKLITPDWRMYGGPPGLPPGEEGLRVLFGTFGPIEQTWTVDDVIAEGDRVVVRATNNVIQDQFMGIPAAGVRQVFTATFTHRIADGLIAETWRNADDLGRMLQLGVRLMPPDLPEE
jgi:predicted ester cyclase